MGEMGEKLGGNEKHCDICVEFFAHAPLPLH